MFNNGMVENDVGFALGPHPQLERRAANRSVSFYSTIGPARLEVGR